MNDALPGGHHPHQDVLADLAAEALPLDQAREVEAHVMTCRECEQLLVAAERVRALLSVPDPPAGPMPDDVWARIELGLAAELSHQGQEASERGWFDTSVPTGPIAEVDPTATSALPLAPLPGSSVPDPSLPDPSLPDASPPTSALPASPGPVVGSPRTPPPARNLPPAAAAVPSPPPSMSFDEAPTAAWKAFLSEPPEPPPAPPVPQRVGRAVRSVRSRRDVRAEDEVVRWWTRPGLVAAAAAAALAVLGVGGWATMSLLGDDHTDAVVDALPGAGARSVLHASGADYTASTLPQQAVALVKTGSPGAAAPGGAKPVAGVKPSAAPSGSAVPVTPGTVSDPAQLASCLHALGETDRQPVAVDLARYQGREAAVIVLPGKVGGYDVWVVPRNCRPGAESPLAFKAVAG